MIELEPVDLAAASGHELPGVEDGRDYLAFVHGQYIVGNFRRLWYGLHFDCDWGASGMQFDAPGSNLSTWEAVWRLPIPEPAWSARVKARRDAVNAAREEELEAGSWEDED